MASSLSLPVSAFYVDEPALFILGQFLFSTLVPRWLFLGTDFDLGKRIELMIDVDVD